MGAIVREARASDRMPLMSFIREIWGGHDYIPYVWDEWLRAEGGKMFVVEVDGVPVGMNRVFFMEDGSAWFEGVRIHPKFRGMGLASLLGENSVGYAHDRGIKVYRLTSGSHNKAAHRQVARMKFSERARVSIYEPRKGSKPSRDGGAKVARPRELSNVKKTILGSKEFRLGGGVFWDNLRAVSLTPKTIEDLVRKGSVWLSGRAVGIFRMGSEGREIWKQVCFIAGDVGDSVSLAEHLLGLKRKGRFVRDFVFVPHGSPIITGLRKAGFKLEFSMVLFERRAANG